MSPCVCSVIDHRWRQNVVRTRGDSRVCRWCSYHILTSCVIYYWTDARQQGIYLFYRIKKQQKKLFYFKIFQRNSKASLCPLWRTRKKAIWRNLLSYRMKQSHWLLCITMNCDWSRKITPLSNLSRKSLLVDWAFRWKSSSIHVSNVILSVLPLAWTTVPVNSNSSTFFNANPAMVVSRVLRWHIYSEGEYKLHKRHCNAYVMI